MNRWSNSRVRACVGMVVGGWVLGLTAAPAQAQYFGRNKVRYDSGNVRVIETEHFDIHYDNAAEPAARVVARLAERWHVRLGALLDHQLSGRQPIVFYSGHPDFEQTNVIQGILPESTGGVTEGHKRRVLLPSAGALAETDHVLGHELVHAFQYDILGRGAIIERLPLWFIEGMAEYLSLGPTDTHTAMWLRDAARAERLPRIKDLSHPKYFPYRYGHALWAYVGGRWGDAVVGEALKAARKRRSPVRVLETLLDISEEQLSRDWHASIREAYGEPVEPKAGPGVPGREIAPAGSETILSLAPALSPDGRRLVFFSEHEGGIELFLADAETGQVLRRLLSRRLDPHFESLQFVGSSGAWAPDGRRFAFAAVRLGRAVLTIFDADNGRIEREIDVAGVDEVLNPTWSPDGKRVAFSGLHGGLADLFLCDLESERVEALTSDAFADLQPAWAPDGASLAFVTDRFGTDLDGLRWGRYRLARFVLASGDIEALPSFDDAKNVNPQWSGSTLFFLSDRGGVTNVYRTDASGGEIRQVTEVPVGLSGLTGLSPAMTAASASSRLVVTAFSGRRYRLYALDEAAMLAGRELPERNVETALPPRVRQASAVQELLDDPGRGLPAAHAPSAERRYRPRLTADGLAQPFLAVGNSRYGVSIVGGGSFFWSDLLGDHRLAAGVRVNGGPKDVSGIATYENRSGRWTWGGTVQQQTWRASTVSSGLGEQDGRPVSFEQIVRFREYDRAATGRVTYPFDRSRRLELAGGYRHVSFASEAEVRTFSFDTGERLGSRTSEVEVPSSLRLAELGVAFVQDDTQFGPTSAVRGSRLRFEVTPTLGTKSFLGVRLDYRRYLRPLGPVTIAGRVLHYGRYGGDADDPRLAPLFTGYASLVRGYDTLADGRCMPGGCDRLSAFTGSKMLVTNLELRVPALFFLGGRRAYGPIPAELIAFADAASAWRNRDTPPFLGGSSDWIRSVGVGLRVNMLGLALGEIDYVRPLDLPSRNWMLRLRLGAGF